MSSATTAVKFNHDLPQELLKEVPKLGPKDTITLRVYGSYEPTTGKRKLRTLQIPQTDTIVYKGNTYDIAYVSGIGEGGKQILGEIWFYDRALSARTFHGDNAQEMRMLQYLWLCNYRADNPHRTEGKRKMVEIESDQKDHEFVRNKRKKVQHALNTLDVFSDEDVLNFMRANRIADPGSADKRRFKLEEFAESNPDAFINAPLIDYTSLYDVIDEAKKKKIIAYNQTTKVITGYDGREIFEFKGKFGESYKDALAKYLIKPDKENKAALEWIKAEVEKK